MRRFFLAIALLALGAAAGCLKFGTVNQGWAVEYLAAEGLVTLIPETGPAVPLTVRIPENPQEMGPAPSPGGLVRVDLRDKQLTYFDPSAREVRKLAFLSVARTEEVQRGDPRLARGQFPIVDRERRTITIYIPREHKALTIEIAEEHLALPAGTWKFGDEIRFYYKDPGQALRLMNVTKTDLGRAGE